MKTLYNKALLYQYYHSGKWALFMGSGAFAFYTYISLNSAIDTLKMTISSLNSDKLLSYRPENIISEFVILFLIYMMITGINKRNNLTFLTSGPYSKEEIKKNQIIFLFISLITLVVIFLYVNLCVFYREKELLILADNCGVMLIRNTVRLFVSGLAFISYLIVMDCLFSNIGMTLFILGMTPIVFLVDSALLIYIGDTFKSYSIRGGEFFDNLVLYIFSSNTDRELLFNQEIGIMFFILFASIITFTIAWSINKKLIINNINKLFNFPIVEKIFYWVFSFSVILLILTLVIQTFHRRHVQEMYFQNEMTLKGTIIITLIFLGLVAAATIAEKVIRKFMKRFV